MDRDWWPAKLPSQSNVSASIGNSSPYAEFAHRTQKAKILMQEADCAKPFPRGRASEISNLHGD
jgi:hypothetical protein